MVVDVSTTGTAVHTKHPVVQTAACTDVVARAAQRTYLDRPGRATAFARAHAQHMRTHRHTLAAKEMALASTRCPHLFLIFGANPLNNKLGTEEPPENEENEALVLRLLWFTTSFDRIGRNIV